MPSLEVQEYSAVPSGEATSASNHHRDAREVASFLVKFLSLLIVMLAIAVNVFVSLFRGDLCDEVNLESCSSGIFLHSWGTLTLLLDLLSVPLMWASAQSMRSKVHAWMKVVAWFLYVIFSVYGCLILFGEIKPSFLLLLLYFIGALTSFCSMMFYVEYHHCRETPSRPDIMCLEISNTVV